MQDKRCMQAGSACYEAQQLGLHGRDTAQEVPTAMQHPLRGLKRNQSQNTSLDLMDLQDTKMGVSHMAQRKADLPW